MSSTTIELKNKYEVVREEAMEATLKLRVKTLKLTNIVDSLEEKKQENIILRDKNKKLKQELQRTKEEMKQRKSKQCMLQFIQQQQ